MLAYLKRILFIYLDAVQDHKTIKLFQKSNVLLYIYHVYFNV